MSYYQHIPVNKVKPGYAYKLSARNFRYGVAKKSNYGNLEFIGIRTKFQSTYLFAETHWDEDPSFGTVKPLSEIEKCPIEIKNIHIDNPELFTYLESLENNES